MKKPRTEHVQLLDIPKQIEGIRVGKVVKVNENGCIFVNYAGNPQGEVAARVTSSVKLVILRQAALSGQEVLLAFENNDSLRPIIIDTLSSLIDEITQAEELDLKVDKPKDVTIEGQKITFDAKDEVVIKCGKASITLKKDGKIVIKGANLISRASKINKIKGASVQLN